jgi:hypothetical protein
MQECDIGAKQVVSYVLNIMMVRFLRLLFFSHTLTWCFA